MMVRIRKERNKEYLSNTPITLKTLIHMIRKGKKRKKKEKKRKKRKKEYLCKTPSLAFGRPSTS